MNIAVVFAGGTGQRMNLATKPKQFLEVNNKPILVYTLEHFENHKDIDGIVLVCLDSWIDYCQKMLKHWSITKVKSIIAGGQSGQASIFNGLCEAHRLYPEDSIVLIHDGVRPLINEDIITQNIEAVKKFGNAITVSPAIETIFKKTEDGVIGEILPRSQCQLAKAPQSFILKDIFNTHLQAQREKLADFIDSASMMQYYGFHLVSVEGPYENIKITTPSDFYIFKAVLDAKENMQILGI